MVGVGGRSLTAPERDSPGPPPVLLGPPSAPALVPLAVVVPWRSCRLLSGLCFGRAPPVRSAGLPWLSDVSGEKSASGCLLPALPLYHGVKGKGPKGPGKSRP